MRLRFSLPALPCSTSASLLAPFIHAPVVPLPLSCSFSAVLHSVSTSVSEAIITRAVGESQCRVGLEPAL